MASPSWFVATAITVHASERILRLLGVAVTQKQSQWSALKAHAWTHLRDV